MPPDDSLDKDAHAIFSHQVPGESHPLLLFYFERLPFLGWIKDREGRYIFANDQFVRACGSNDTQSIIGRTDMDIWPQALAESYRADDREVMHSRLPKITEESFALPQGERWFEVYKCPLLDTDGEVTGTMAMAHDITERKSAELSSRTSEERWQFALEGAGHGVWDLNGTTGKVYYSKQWKSMLGYEEHEIGDSLREWCDRTHPDEQGPCEGDLMACLEGEIEYFANERRVRCKDGNYRWFLARGKVIERATDGYVRRLIGTMTDINEQKEAESRLREAATVFAVSSEAIMVTDANGVIKAINPAFTEITGYTSTEVLGHTPRILKSGHHPPEYFKRLWHNLREIGEWAGEVWNKRKNGKIYPEWQSITAVRDGAGVIVEYVSVFSDITRRKLTEDEIRYRANYDVLTGLPNRSLFGERLEQSLREATRTNTTLAVLFMDLDHFKQVNDTLGHAQGDLLLQEVASRIRNCVRISDTIARFGGDEFVLCLPNIDNGLDAGQVALKIIKALAQPIELDDRVAHIGASIGITIFPDDGHDAPTLYRNADLAMYRAKDLGRGNYQFFENSMTHNAMERQRLEESLRDAFKRHELYLNYQPILSLEPNPHVAGLEVLLRWTDAERGPVSPATFIPIAEEIGLIRELGRWVIETACRQLTEWKLTRPHLHLAVNVSARQIPESLSPAWLAGTVQLYGLSPSDLILEITEGVLLADSEHCRVWLQTMHDMGFGLSLDDFGTGYSSLAYLKRMPVDIVKIDKSFIQGIEAETGDWTLVAAILAMARSLGVDVVAEGIETIDQFRLLQTMGCSYVQGYYLSRPIAADQVPDTLTRLDQTLPSL